MFTMCRVSGSYPAGLGLVLLSRTSGVRGRTPKPRDTGFGPRPNAVRCKKQYKALHAHVNCGEMQNRIVSISNYGLVKYAVNYRINYRCISFKSYVKRTKVLYNLPVKG